MKRLISIERIKKIALSILLVSSFLFFNSAFASSFCKVLFKDNLSINYEAFKKEGFYLNEKLEIFDLTRLDKNKKAIKIGRLELANNNYFFRYTSHEAAKRIAEGQEAFEIEIENSHFQTTGKGIYVSTWPTDSSDRGSQFVILKPDRPLLYLNNRDANAETAYYLYSEEQTQRLQRSGIDMIQNSVPRWFNIIRAEAFKSVEIANSKNIQELLAHLDYAIDLFLYDKKFRTKKIFSQLPDDHLIKKIINQKEISIENLVKLFERLYQRDQIYEFISILADSEKGKEYLNSFIKTFMQHLKKSANPEHQEIYRMTQSYLKALKI